VIFGLGRSFQAIPAAVVEAEAVVSSAILSTEELAAAFGFAVTHDSQMAGCLITVTIITENELHPHRFLPGSLFPDWLQ